MRRIATARNSQRVITALEPFLFLLGTTNSPPIRAMLTVRMEYGVALKNGQSVSRDVVEAAKHFKFSADQGNAIGQNAYGNALSNSEWVSKFVEIPFNSLVSFVFRAKYTDIVDIRQICGRIMQIIAQKRARSNCNNAFLMNISSVFQ
jgi:hypothetical protein